MSEDNYLKKELYELVKTDESIFDFIQEGSLDGLWYWDLENPENEWMNNRFWKVLGYDPDKMPHKSSAWQNIINQDDLELANENFSKHCENPDHPYDQVVRYTHKDGSTVWIRCRGMAIRDKNEKPIRMLGAHQDVSDYKNREKELIKAKEKAQKSEARFRQVSKVAEVLIWEVDCNGLYTYVSPVIEPLLGYTPDEVVGKKYFYDFFSPEKREEFKKAAFEFFAKRESIKNFENPLIHKNGQLVYVETTGSPIFDDGNFMGYRGVDIEITERKKAEDKLRESESRFRKLYEYGPNGMVLADSDFKFLMTNHAFCQMTGYKEEELKELTIIDITHPADIDKNVAKAKKMKSREVDAYRMEKRYIKKNGQTIWANLSVSPIYDSNNQFQYFIGIVSDITQRKKAEEENTEIRQRFELISQHIPGVIYQFRLLPDGTLHFPYASPGIYDIYGVNPEDVEHDATAAFSALHPDDLEQVRASINHSAQTLTPWHDIYRVNHPSGKTIWVEGNSTPQKLDDGSIIWHGYIQDITERKKAEEKDKEIQKRFELISQHIPGVIYQYRLRPDGSSHIPYASSGAYDIYGVDPEVAKHDASLVFSMMHPDDLEQVRASITHSAKTLTPFQINYRVNHPSGKIIWVEGNSTPEKLDDGSIIWHGYVQDITERKRAGQELMESEEMLRNSQSLAHICAYSTDLNLNELEKSTWICSPEFYKIFGIDETYPHTLEGWTGFIHPDYREEIFAYHQYVVNERIPFNKEYKIIRINDGAERWVHGTGELVYDEKGTPVRMHGAIQDITERKKTEADLTEAKNKAEENEKRYRALHNASFGGIVIHDKGLILDCNQGLSEITGYSVEELTGMNGLLLISVKTRDKVKANIVAGYEKPYEAIGIRKNGEEYPLQLEARNIPYEGKQVRVVEFRDITERKKAEEQLKRTARIMSNSQEIAHFGSWKLDLTTEKLEWSDETYRIMGLDPNGPPPAYNEMLEKSIHPDDAKLLDETFKAALQEQGIYELEHRIVRPDGSVRWAFEKGHPYFDKNGNLLGYDGATLDITERKKAEEQLKLYIRALEASSVSVVITGANGHIEYVNPFFTEITGYTLEEVRGKNPRILKSGKQNEDFYEELWNTIKSGKDWSGEFQNKKKNGELFWEKAIISPIKSTDSGKITHFVAIKEDITELLEKEDQLKQSLKEKEVLLAEIHHRVKNNLAVVSGMMQLQSFDEESPEVQEKLSDSISRIKTIAKIHEKLYQHETFSSIDLSENIRELTHENVNSLSAGKAIEVEVSLEQVVLNINEAVPCSLIVNEVLVNALKHAFINEEAGNISVHLSEQKNQVQITITDNGIGLPEDFSPKNQSSGTMIIQVLTEQLEGEYRYKQINTGTEFTLTFEKTAIKGSSSTFL